jgi:hypothetical protein
MTVQALIELLQKADPKDEVKAFDPDSGQIESVSGMVYGGADSIVELCTDDPND